MTNALPVTLLRHKNRSWRAPEGYRFAGRDVVVPLCVSELASAAGSLVIGFLRQSDGIQVVALMGLEAQRNLLVGEDGAWAERHVPVAYLSHPFVLGRAPSGEFMLCVAEAGGLVLDSRDGHPFFTFDGLIHPSVKQIMDGLGAAENERAASARQAALLDAAGVLRPMTITVPTPTGPRLVEGVERVDEAALNALAPEQFVALRDAGVLSLAYCQMISMQNLPRLIERAVKQPPVATPGSALMELDFSRLAAAR